MGPRRRFALRLSIVLAAVLKRHYYVWQSAKTTGQAVHCRWWFHGRSQTNPCAAWPNAAPLLYRRSLLRPNLS